jgi:CelD/BcsL family acetyltransferase involved in cellulose biosynthesis
MHSNADYLDYNELTDVDFHNWQGFQALDGSLASPYFSPAYFKAVNQVRPGVKVLRFHENGRPAAYWPFRKGAFGTARPVAGSMDDLHGIIAHPAARLDLRHADVRRRIGGYAFSAVPFGQRRHGLHGQSGDGNQVIDLSHGFEAWLAARSADSSNFRREWRKSEKLMANADVSIRHDVIDMASFDRLIALKQDAYRRSGHFDIFGLSWPRSLLLALLETKTDTARGILSTLTIGDEVAAICFCMRSTSVLHYWFPAYEAKFAKQKPGLALLFSLAQWAAEEGMSEFHLGLGNTQYKRQMASWMMPVRGGAMALSPAQHFATEFTAWSHRLEGQNRLLNVPAKYARKYERMALSGTWRA